MIHKVSDDEMIDELTGYHLNEVAHMNPPEDELCGIDILEYAESDECCKEEPHFHFCKGRKGNGLNHVVDIEEQIWDIDKMTILSSKTGNLTWNGLEELQLIVTEWLNRKAFDADMLNKEALRQTWNRCNMSNRVMKEEL